MVEISRNCEDESVMDNGNAPARKHLEVKLDEAIEQLRLITYVNAITRLSMSNMNKPSNILTPCFQ
jgi:hypothetical protein